ncbi:hypothetical protein JW711_06280 [Candidatus Woesearchaeota archaeon]|nr:hypothetical protein [Candidatus Woesearchaeota archaeon]
MVTMKRRDVSGRVGARGAKHLRAQLEIMGLIIIVLIVATSLMLYMVYKINNPERSPKAAFVNKELASNFLITVTKVNVLECPHHTVTDLVTDCANSIQKRIYCGGESSCVVANRTLFAMLAPTMEELGKNFSFSIENTDISYTGACDNKEKVQATQVLPLAIGFGHVSMVLDVCDVY